MPSGSKKRKAAKKTPPKQDDYLTPTDPPAAEGRNNGQAEADQAGEREPFSPKTPDRGMECGEEEEEEEEEEDAAGGVRTRDEEGAEEEVITGIPLPPQTPAQEFEPDDRGRLAGEWVEVVSDHQQQLQEAGQEANEVALIAARKEGDGAEAADGDEAAAADGDGAPASIGDSWESLTPASTADGEPAAMANQQGEGGDGDCEPVIVAEEVVVPVDEDDSDLKAEEENQGGEDPLLIVAEEGSASVEEEDVDLAVGSEVIEPEADEPAPEGPTEEALDDAAVIEEVADVPETKSEADESGPGLEETQELKEDPAMEGEREVEAPVMEEEAKAGEAQEQVELGPASTEEPREISVAIDSEAAVMGDAGGAGPVEEVDAAAVTEEEDGASKASAAMELEAVPSEPSAVELEAEPVQPVIDDTEPVIEEIEAVQPVVDETDPAADDTDSSTAMEEAKPTPAVDETDPTPDMEETEPSTVTEEDAELAPPAAEEEPQEEAEPSLIMEEAEAHANVEQTEATPANEEAGLSDSVVEPSVDVAAAILGDDEGEQTPATESDDPLRGLEGTPSGMEDDSLVAPMDQSDEPATEPREEIVPSSESGDPLRGLEGASSAMEDDNIVAPPMDQSDEPAAAPGEEIAPLSSIESQVQRVDLASVEYGSEALQIVAPKGGSLDAGEQEVALDAGMVEVPYVVSEEEVAEILGEDEEAHTEAEASSVPVEEDISVQVDEALDPVRDEGEYALESGPSGEVGVALTPMESDKGGGDEASGTVERELLSNGPSAPMDEVSQAEVSTAADASEEAEEGEHLQNVPEISYTSVDMPTERVSNSEQPLDTTALDDGQQQVVHDTGGETREEAPPAVEDISVVQEEDVLKQEQSVSSAYEEIRAVSTEFIGNSTLEGPKKEPLLEEPIDYSKQEELIEISTQEEPTQNGVPVEHSVPEATVVQGKGVTETALQDDLSPTEGGPEAETALEMREAENVEGAGEEKQQSTVVAVVENLSHNELANTEKAPDDAATEKSTAIIEVYRNEKTPVKADNRHALMPVTEKDVYVDQRSLEQNDVAAARARGPPIVVAQKSKWWGCCGMLDAFLNRS